jgi:multidrug efflux system outer membrane protein
MDTPRRRTDPSAGKLRTAMDDAALPKITDCGQITGDTDTAHPRWPTLAAAALLLSGCASMAPPYETPALAVVPRYAEDTSQTGPNAAATGWRDYFTDPRLQTLIAQALDNNRDLRSAALRVEEARAAYGIQRADLLPSIGLQAGIDRSRTPADLNITGMPLLGNQYQVALGLASWEIDFWGRVRSLRDASLESYLATDAARRAVTVGLIAEVANSDLALRELDERLALARQTTASRQESLRIFTRRVEVGSASRLSQTQMQTLLTQAQALGAQLEQARAQQAHALTLLVGTSLDLTPATNRLDALQMPALQAGLPSDLLTQRPDIVAAEHQLKAAQAQIGAARAAFFPRIALTGLLGTASAELGGLFDSGSQKWVLSPIISLPLFDGGRRDNNLSLSEARRNIAVANYEKTVQGAFRDVADALAAHQWLDRQLTLAQDGLATQAERARLSQLRYDNGATAFLEVLDAQRDLLVAEQQVVQLRRALLSSQVGLYAALGGGSLTGPANTSPAATAHPVPESD